MVAWFLRALCYVNVIRSGHLTVNGALMPVLTLGTFAAAVFSYRRLAEWRPVSGLLFLLLAVLGSLATVYGTLGRQAEVRDLKQADGMAENRTLALKDEELTQAIANAVARGVGRSRDYCAGATGQGKACGRCRRSLRLGQRI